jgi:hypothetical protein
MDPVQNPIEILENMYSPEVFASLASSFSINSGSVTIKFVSLRWDNSVEPAVQRAVVVARITMPLEGAQTLVGGLQSFLAQHKLEYVPSPRERTRASDILAEKTNLVP